MLKNLKLLRQKSGTSQQKLAEVIGVSQQSINKYENHAIEPDIKTLMLLADYFNTSVDYLIGYSNIEHKLEQLHPCDLNEDELLFIQKFRTLSKEERESLKTIENLYIKGKN